MERKGGIIFFQMEALDYGVVFFPTKVHLFPFELVMVKVNFPEDGFRDPLSSPHSVIAPVI